MYIYIYIYPLVKVDRTMENHTLLIGKSTIVSPWAIFNSYVKLPEGKYSDRRATAWWLNSDSQKNGYVRRGHWELWGLKFLKHGLIIPQAILTWFLYHLSSKRLCCFFMHL